MNAVLSKIELSRRALSRRGAIAVLAAAGGSVVFGAKAQEGAAPTKKDFGPGGPAEAFKYWLKIDPDNSVTVGMHMSEMGQGISTALSQLVAEELGADWAKVKFAFTPNDAKIYYNRGYAPARIMESTGGSNSMRGHFTMFREIGATAREMFKSAAAAQWKVPADSISIDAGLITHAASNRSATLGALAKLAAAQIPPKEVQLTPQADWKIIGHSVPRLDTPAKVDGTAQFGADVVLPGMQVATIQICPVYGGKLVSVDEAPALAVKGVTQVVKLENAVAVVGDGYWTVQKGLKALQPQWDYGPRAHYGVAEMNADLDAGLNGPSPTLDAKGDVDATLGKAAKKITVEMYAPYLAHACMEPMNATAHVTPGRVDIWAPAQGATTIVNNVVRLLGVDASTIHITRTYLGGGFGRRGEGDFAGYAALVAKAAGTPVKLMYSREEDMRQDFYRPATKIRMTAGVDARGVLQAVDIAYAGPSITKRRFPEQVKDGKDMSHLSGFSDHPYTLAHWRMRSKIIDNGIPVGFWRAVNHTQNIFYREALINELAERAGMDAITYRRLMLEGNARYLAMLDETVKLSEFNTPLAPAKAGYKRGRGFAIGNSHGSLCGQVADVTVAPDNSVAIDRFTCVIDVGTIVNPKGVEAQMESSIIDGLGMTMFGGMTPKDGGMAENNYSEVRFLRLAEAPPDIRVKVIDWPDTYPGGVGEPAVPPTAAALVDAIARATGNRLKALPVVKQGFSA